MKILKKIRSRVYPFYTSNDIGIEYFRQRLLYYLLLCSFGLGTIAYLTCVYFAYKYNLPAIIIIDTMAIGLIAFLFFNKKLKFATKVFGILTVFYLLGFGLLIAIGPMGAGFLWLVMFSAMTGVLLGTRPVFYS
ncbi:MAG: hypothetical protein L3J69_11985, partial [Desulfobacula sp.]|nr:hypothetical protein [Desulfobacula sp.]